MSNDQRQMTDDELAGHFHDALQATIQQCYKRAGDDRDDKVAWALLYLLLRLANTWRSIRTLRKYTLHQDGRPDDEGFMLDAGALLRAMFDAYLQAGYIVSEPEMRADRAAAYLDFAHVERYKTAQRILSPDNPHHLAERLRSSPNRPQGEQRLQEAYDQVKHNSSSRNGARTV